MIHFEIQNSPDLNVKSAFTFHKNDVYLGSHTGDLVIRDSGLRASHLILEVVEGDLLVHPQKEVDFYLINGKRATSVRKIRVSDTLTIGNTTLKILGFDHTKLTTKKEILDVKLAHLMETSSPLIPVIEKISRLMK